ncbi:MAG: DUF6090 family protein, partial [Maribacter sp.]|nr:DUF6090 family protein [Maribacter sp.]
KRSNIGVWIGRDSWKYEIGITKLEVYDGRLSRRILIHDLRQNTQPLLPMINFFRKIRKKLADDNKPLKYMRYAIGEIVLVVIGILIALQINNWNESRKSKLMANDAYRNLLASLQQDSTEVQQIIEVQTINLETIRKLILNDSIQELFELDENRLDSLARDIMQGGMSFFPKTGIYNLTVSNNGMDLLQSKEIKARLINLYDYQYKQYENVDAIIDHKYQYQIGPVLRKKIGFITDNRANFNVVKGVNPELFKKYYSELLAECKDTFGLLSIGYRSLLQIRESVNELMLLIRNELKKQ